MPNESPNLAEEKSIVWLKATEIFSEGFSKCPRRKFSAIIVDQDNQVISIGYNGNIRGQEGHLCGNDICLRDSENIKSGQNLDVGCIHAEENAILNCARQGKSCVGATIYVNGEPCKKCAARIAQAGITRLIYQPTGYPDHGIPILEENNVEIIKIK